MLKPYYEAFHKLNSRRQYGMAELPLLNSEIYLHGRIHHFEPDMDFFYRAMVEMDEEYMLHILKKRKEEQDNKTKPTGKS